MRPMLRLPATAVTLASLAVLAVGAPAASAHGKGKQLRLVAEENQSAFVDVGTPGPSLGDEQVFSETLYNRGREAGTSGGVCTATEVTPPYGRAHLQLRRDARASGRGRSRSRA